eukprot:CAMPEP_0176262860 /NCGR_PEP_ID=MMETSP0121_2-20121125/40830_1 /TAXON_ID=160619 /ORGANISM="Kryptoperidinium foliaceum, Strain CCMP 1326" /LENGTH=146 /DNA_ID=CAMNT_0017602843 /DNA_START=42 /DNA_END=478 /DNA_ORIENTATION=-
MPEQPAESAAAAAAAAQEALELESCSSFGAGSPVGGAPPPTAAPYAVPSSLDADDTSCSRSSSGSSSARSLVGGAGKRAAGGVAEGGAAVGVAGARRETTALWEVLVFPQRCRQRRRRVAQLAGRRPAKVAPTAIDPLSGRGPPCA